MRESVQLYVSNYFNFSGRTSRRNYWFIQLFLFVGTIVISLVSLISALNLLLALWFFGNIIPATSLLVRRLHDRDFSAWVILAAFIPAIGTLILLFLSILPGTRGFNRFGPATDSFYADDYYSQSSEEDQSYRSNSYQDRYETQESTVYYEEDTFSDDEWEDF